MLPVGLWKTLKKMRKITKRKPRESGRSRKLKRFKTRCEGKTGKVEGKQKTFETGTTATVRSHQPSTRSWKQVWFLVPSEPSSSPRHFTIDTNYLPTHVPILSTFPKTTSTQSKEPFSPSPKGKPNETLNSTLVNSAKWLTTNNKIIPTKRVFNTKKVSDHFAIIPTGKLPPAKLDESGLRNSTNWFLQRFFCHLLSTCRI